MNVPRIYIYKSAKEVHPSTSTNEDRLNGAARKRLKWLLSKGLSYEKTSKEALKLMPSRNKGPKRLRSDSTPEQKKKKVGKQSGFPERIQRPQGADGAGPTYK